MANLFFLNVRVYSTVPLTLPTSEYLDRLNRVLNGNITSAFDFDVKFAAFNPQQKNIMGIYVEYRRFLENVPENIITEGEKNRKIVGVLMRFIPYSLHPFLNAIQNAQGGILTKTSFENFIKF